LWDEFTIAIRHGNDHRLVREIFERLLRETVGEYAQYAKQSWKVMVGKYRIEDARVEPMVSMVVNDN
jgi:hypothetical protein